MRFDHEGEIPYFHKLNKFYFPRKAFLGRKEKGLGLSDRVWRYTTEFKNEIELGLDVGIRNGSDAAKMARELNTFLQNPDKLFRRVRDEHGMLKLSKAAKGFHPGQGVYRSSYKNARRLAATETNMAYRTADYERWQQMDFVVGIEIHLSNNHTCLGRDGKPHPFTDICDELQGVYPKDFKFTGWHPHCRCYATTIFKTDEEFKADEERMLRGEEPTAPEDSENAVNDMPKQFNDWIEEHREQIELSRLRGNEPYFLRDNTGRVNTALGISQSQPVYIQPTLFDTAKPEAPKVTPAEARAKVIDELRKRGSLPKEAIDKLEQITDPEEFNRRADSLQAVAERHEKRTGAQAKKLQKRWNERDVPHKALLKSYNSNSEVDSTFKAINNGLPTGTKWFENGDLDLNVTTDKGINGGTDMEGMIELTSERIKGVKEALGKIANRQSKSITEKEADAMATFWHEITHNRNKIGNVHLGDRAESYMELANEFVARKTLPEFYKVLGCKETPHKKFMDDRNSTGYNEMVKNYDTVITRLKLDGGKVLDAVRKQLYEESYTQQKKGLINGLQSGGIKKADGTAAKGTDVAKIVELCEGKRWDDVEDWLKNNGYITEK